MRSPLCVSVVLGSSWSNGFGACSGSSPDSGAPFLSKRRPRTSTLTPSWCVQVTK
jgi:hypothetical protein